MFFSLTYEPSSINSEENTAAGSEYLARDILWLGRSGVHRLAASLIAFCAPVKRDSRTLLILAISLPTEPLIKKLRSKFLYSNLLVSPKECWPIGTTGPSRGW